MKKKSKGRPKGQSNINSKASYGPLGDLMRKARLGGGLGLLDVAKACDCSVQFVSNIEHGRAPLPWEKIERLSKVLKVSSEALKAANFSVRSDFKRYSGISIGSKLDHSALLFASNDPAFKKILGKYQAAPTSLKKKFLKQAKVLLSGES